MNFENRDIISILELKKEEIEFILEKSAYIEDLVNKKEDISFLKGKILANLFYEPSTRTRLSFESAMKKLGGETIGFSKADTSSVAKGETLADTVRTVEKYADVIVLRHTKEGAAKLAAEYSNAPVINAGDGAGQHPTQTLLDLYTIKKEKGRIDNLVITIVGDLHYGRTVHSLTHALSKYSCKINLVSPKDLRLPQEVLNDIKDTNSEVYEYENLNECISETDVLYITRIQKERFVSDLEYNKVKGSYVINKTILESVKSDMIILHPLPRVDEISCEVDETKHAKYFDQTYNGLIVRMALLSLLLGAI